VYAGTRQPFIHSDERVTPITLDVTDAAQIQGAVGSVESLDILVNNAGVDLHDDLSNRAGLDPHLAVNLFGTHGAVIGSEDDFCRQLRIEGLTGADTWGAEISPKR
jgi:NAD(P)-dependent dehydrogenase (short-subunit alcohol dehydrogenase family)